MVLSRGTGKSPFLILYGCKLIIADELKFVDFVEPASYEVAIQSHI